MERRSNIRLLMYPAIILALASCASPEIVEEPFEPTTSHADYRDGLVAMEIAETAAGTAWIRAADRALTDAFLVTIPVREIAYFDPLRPDAVGFRFAALRGQRIEIILEIENGAETRMFADLFRVEPGELDPFPQVASYSEHLNRLEFEPRRDGEYLLRLQPELLRGGRYTVSIRTVPALSFPVEGHGVEDILSVFGDPRDGGARRHEGVDIFAPRGTPVLAVAPGVVRSVGTRDRGGLVVSITDPERQLVYYYAHLDEQLTTRGTLVRPGDVIGTVGNTGNAVTTPPHLHFGIYERRWNAIDPWNFLFPYRAQPPEVRGNPTAVGSPARVVSDSVSLDGVAGRAPVPIDADEPVLVEGARGTSYRIHVPRLAMSGYVPQESIGF